MARVSKDVPSPDPGRSSLLQRRLFWLGIAGGFLLFAIGVRFIVDPGAAQRTFGLPRQLAGSELHAVSGLRDLWLGGLAVAFAWLRQWRALALWLLMGALVCFGDGLIVLNAGFKAWALAFHWGCGVVCLWGGARCWRIGADSA